MARKKKEPEVPRECDHMHCTLCGRMHHDHEKCPTCGNDDSQRHIAAVGTEIYMTQEADDA